MFLPSEGIQGTTGMVARPSHIVPRLIGDQEGSGMRMRFRIGREAATLPVGFVDEGGEAEQANDRGPGRTYRTTDRLASTNLAPKVRRGPSR